jgi:GntR family transcriptional regulator, transcriptional repressor for pyruvate dehydrogenase complex
MRSTATKDGFGSDLTDALEPIPRVDLTDAVIARFKSLLAQGKLKPGGRLPSERELSTLLGISRPSLRHGLKALEVIGAIEARRRHGTFVSESAANVLEEPLHLAVLLSSTTFEELHEVRRAVEVELVGLAALRVTDDELKLLNDCLASQRAAVRSPEEFLRKDLEFHNLVARASHNMLFAEILGSLRGVMSGNMQRLLEAPKQELRTNVASTLEEHEEILKRLRAHNETGARNAMLHHLKKVYAQWLSLSKRSKTASGQ